MTRSHIRLLLLALAAAFVLALGAAPAAHAITVGPVTAPDGGSGSGGGIEVGELIPPECRTCRSSTRRRIPRPVAMVAVAAPGSGAGGGDSSSSSETSAPATNSPSSPTASKPHGGSGTGRGRGAAEASRASVTGVRRESSARSGESSDRPARKRGGTARKRSSNQNRSRRGPELLVASELAGPGRKGKEDEQPTLIERLASPIPREYRLPVFLITGLALLLGVISIYTQSRRRRAERHAFSDSLTNLPNRKAFEQRLASEWKRAERYNRPLGLLLMDVDGFKQINDTQGHAAGDRALRDVAAVIGTQTGESDMAARLSGDEFVALCPETPCDNLKSLAGVLELSLRRLDIKVSIGYAEREAYDRGPADLVDRADAAMYREKDRRRLLARDEPAAALSS